MLIYKEYVSIAWVFVWVIKGKGEREREREREHIEKGGGGVAHGQTNRRKDTGKQVNANK